MAAVRAFTPEDLLVASPKVDLRHRHVRKAGSDWYLITNEGLADLELELTVAATGRRAWVDPMTGLHADAPEAGSLPLQLAPYAAAVLQVAPC